MINRSRVLDSQFARHESEYTTVAQEWLNYCLTPLLLGDWIENPASALVMLQAARAFGAECRFRDTKGLAASAKGAVLFNPASPSLDADSIGRLHSRTAAFDNLPGAADVYGYDAGRGFALMVGNELCGLSYECARLATDKVQVPMITRPRPGLAWGKRSNLVICRSRPRNSSTTIV